MRRGEQSVLFDQFVGAGDERPRNGEAERLGGLEVDHQVELGREVNRQVARLCSAQNAVDIGGSTPMQFGGVRSVRYQVALGGVGLVIGNRWQPVLSRQLQDQSAIGVDK